MQRNRRIVWILAVVSGVALVAAIAPAFLRAWRCVDDWSSGDVHAARVVASPPGHGLVVRLPSGEGCVVGVGARATYAWQADEVVRVVSRSDRPGDCEFESTVEASEALLATLASAIVIVLLLIALVAIAFDRLLGRIAERKAPPGPA